MRSSETQKQVQGLPPAAMESHQAQRQERDQSSAQSLHPRGEAEPTDKMGLLQGPGKLMATPR